MDIKYIHDIFLECQSVSIDTRKIYKNTLFIALKGDRYDANTFAKEALENGALYVIIDDESVYIDHRTIVVENSLTTLQELAKYHRHYLELPIIALTGSNGKTTTKELLTVVLAKKYNTKATIGNLNNHIGVPLTLLSFTKETEIGIVEMGANHQKEIAFLCELAKPNYGYITNFGKAHLEGFGGIEGVIKGKSEMYDFLRLNERVVFVNLDDDIQVKKSIEITSFSFGICNPQANVSIDAVTANPLVSVMYKKNAINSHLIGLYNANNINAAIAVGSYFKVAMSDIKIALESYTPTNNRSQLITKNTNSIILDAYNANPSSMKVAIENFLQLDNPEKIIVLGDMFELGTDSYKEHNEIVQMLIKSNDIHCYFVGESFFETKIEKNNFSFHNTFENFSNDFTKEQLVNTSILIKGSRGMALERTLDLL